MYGLWENVRDELIIDNATFEKLSEVNKEELECQEAKMRNQLKAFHKANHDAGFEVSNDAMGKFLIYLKSVHLDKYPFIKKGSMGERELMRLAAGINDELDYYPEEKDDIYEK